MDWEPCAFYRPTAPISPMTAASSATIRVRRGTGCAASTCNGLVARLHCFPAVRFIGADAAEACFLRRGLGARCRMRKCTCAFELAEDGFLVSEQVADEAVGVAFVHGQVGVEAWAEDAGREVVGEGCDEFFVSGS